MNNQNKIFMVTEDYVPFKIAKLLEEKGFPIDEFHNSEIGMFNGIAVSKITKERVEKEILSCIPQSVVMKWLRENYDIHIVIFPSSFEYGDKYTYSIYYKRSKKDKNYQLHFQSREKTFENAVNEAIEHCLTKLI